MPTPTKGARLGGSPSHERLMLANLATSLFEHGRITTTEAKAKRLRPLAERLITKSKKGDLHNRREVMKTIRDKDVVHKLFAEIGPFFADRSGGYTRIVKTMPRRGDNAHMAIIELVNEKTATSEAEAARGTKFAQDQSASQAPASTGSESVPDETAAGEASPTGEEPAESSRETTEGVESESDETSSTVQEPAEGSRETVEDDLEAKGENKDQS